MTQPEPTDTRDQATCQRSVAKYRKRAAGYDRTCGPTWTIRERTIAALDLGPGQGVLDVACGTGLSLALLRDRVGEGGHVYGFDHSAEMLAQAHARVAAAGWRNVTLVQSAAQTFTVPHPVDAVLFHYTHDILRSPVALSQVLGCARPDARVAIAGVNQAATHVEDLGSRQHDERKGGGDQLFSGVKRRRGEHERRREGRYACDTQSEDVWPSRGGVFSRHVSPVTMPQALFVHFGVEKPTP